jgi:hypothetical protein
MKNKIDEMMSSFLGDAGVVRVKFSVHVVKKITIEVGEIVGFVRCRRQLNMCCYRIVDGVIIQDMHFVIHGSSLLMGH